jgi:multimeric flavodoxin WrbA
MVREALEAARQAGAETEMLLVADNDIAPCDGCGACTEGEGCIIDDGMQRIFEKLELRMGLYLAPPYTSST